jgi:hypothetical protein
MYRLETRFFCRKLRMVQDIRYQELGQDHVMQPLQDVEGIFVASKLGHNRSGQSRSLIAFQNRQTLFTFPLGRDRMY